MQEREARCTDEEHITYIKRILSVLKTKLNSYNSKLSNVGFSAVPNHNNGKCSISNEGLSAVPVPKYGTNLANKVGLTAVPTTKNGNFENLNGGFSAVPDQNNGNGSSLKECSSAVLLRKDGTNQIGFSAVTIRKNSYLENLQTGFPLYLMKITVKVLL